MIEGLAQAQQRLHPGRQTAAILGPPLSIYARAPVCPLRQAQPYRGGVTPLGLAGDRAASADQIGSMTHPVSG